MIFLRRCPAQFAFVLEGPLRRWLLQPARLVASLPLSAETRVLDLGAGSGVVAQSVMPQMRGGQLILLDAQRRMLSRARRRLAPVPGVRPAFTVGVAEFLPFPEATFDVVLMVTVLGEVDEPAMTMREVHRVLRPGGMLSISEHLPDPDFRSLGRVRAMLRTFGFKERELRGGRWSYTLNATRIALVAA